MVLPSPRIRCRRRCLPLLHVATLLCRVDAFTGSSRVNHPHHETASSTRSALHAAPPAAIPRQCTDCLATFPSGSALFKHLRFDNCREDEHFKPEVVPVRHSVALFFGYAGVAPETAGTLLLEAFFAGDSDRTLVGSTQASIAKNRHALLQQDADCPSGMDTMVVNYLSAAVTEGDAEAEATVANNLQATLQTLLLDNKQTRSAVIRLHGMRTLDTKLASLHAEQSCTQHVYHYMVPVAWLPDSDAIEEWHRESVATGNLRWNQRHAGTTPRPADATPSSLRNFRDILRRAESERRPTLQSQGRFRTLAYNARRPWHNYCDPALRASPNHDVTRRSVDRARFREFATRDGRLCAVYEFRGDQFLSQQVRRIVGAAVAMAHGWLPAEFADTLRLAETPLAPPGYLYQAAPRFHYAELYHKGVELFGIQGGKDGEGWSTTRLTAEDPIKWIQQQLLADSSNDTEWLDELRDVVAPRICAARQEQEPTYDSGDLAFTQTAPQEYARVLQLLRDMVADGDWPATSAARSRVMSTPEDSSRAGSFTVVDEAQFDVTCPPRANALFPELAAAVFELQASLSSNDVDPTSSHCAVNCNAQFTPHVDSGRGAGQSLSTIVGLGDYRAGEIVVEGDACDIRYRPLTFDGWKLRHWTRPFSGERFSLVWFTPEGVERK